MQQKFKLKTCHNKTGKTATFYIKYFLRYVVFCKMIQFPLNTKHACAAIYISRVYVSVCVRVCIYINNFINILLAISNLFRVCEASYTLTAKGDFYF